MLLLLVALFVLVPLVEITVIIQVADLIGGWNAVGLLLVISIAGAWLTRHEGFVVLSRMREQLDQGRVPTNELIDGALVLAAGVLMLTPGFVTDAFGLLLVFPPTRAIVRSLLKRRFHGRVDMLDGRPFGRGDDPDDVIDV